MKTLIPITPIEFTKHCLLNIGTGKIPIWSGCEIEEINFKSNIGGRLDIKLHSGSDVNVNMGEIKFV